MEANSIIKKHSYKFFLKKITEYIPTSSLDPTLITQWKQIEEKFQDFFKSNPEIIKTLFEESDANSDKYDGFTEFFKKYYHNINTNPEICVENSIKMFIAVYCHNITKISNSLDLYYGLNAFILNYPKFDLLIAYSDLLLDKIKSIVQLNQVSEVSYPIDNAKVEGYYVLIQTLVIIISHFELTSTFEFSTHIRSILNLLIQILDNANDIDSIYISQSSITKEFTWVNSKNKKWSFTVCGRREFSLIYTGEHPSAISFRYIILYHVYKLMKIFISCTSKIGRASCR